MKKIICIFMIILLTAVHINALETELSYTDVKESDWYYKYIMWGNGYMNGFPDGSFRPKDNLTREQAAMILYKWKGKNATYDSYHFKDVIPGSWYADAVEWLYQNGFTKGVSKERFGVGQYITRQDLVVLIYNVNYELWHNHPDYKYDWSDSILNKFKDKDDISDYAIPAFNLACNTVFIDDHYMHIYITAEPFIKGDENNMLHPKAFCTRAEAAVMIHYAQLIY